MKLQRFPAAFAFGLASILAPGVARACAVCLAGAGPNDPLTDAFSWSIIFLMAMPYTIVGSVAGWLFYNHRRASAKKAARLRLAWIHKESGR